MRGLSPFCLPVSDLIGCLSIKKEKNVKSLSLRGFLPYFFPSRAVLGPRVKLIIQSISMLVAAKSYSFLRLLRLIKAIKIKTITRMANPSHTA